MAFESHRSRRRRRLGNSAGAHLRARRAEGHALGSRTPPTPRSLQQSRASMFLPGVRLDDAIAVGGRRGRGRAAPRDPSGRAGAGGARGLAIARAADRRAKRRSSSAPRVSSAARRKFMTEIVAECAPGAVPAILSGPSFAADVARGLPTAVTLAAGDDKLARELAQAIGSATLSALSFDRRSRRRNRRRRQERARHRRGHGHRPRPGRERRGGIDHARLRRAHALRQGLRRQAGNHDGPVRARRSDFDLLEPAVAQFHFRRQSRPW